MNSHYSQSKAYDLSPNPDRPIMNQSMTTQSIPNPCIGMIGVVKEGCLHLSPIKGMAVLRPSLDYLDKLKDAEKERNLKLVQRQSEQSNDSTTEAKLMQVTVRSNEDKEGQKKAQQNELLRREQDEEWKQVVFYPIEVLIVFLLLLVLLFLFLILLLLLIIIKLFYSFKS